MNKIESFSHDKFYKFLYNQYGIIAHNFFNNDGSTIEFDETEIPDTGQKGDIKYLVDKKTLKLVEIQKNPLTLNKLRDMFDYHESARLNKMNEIYTVESQVIALYKPTQGIKKGMVYPNIEFGPEIKFTQKIDGTEILNTILDKYEMQENLNEMEQVSLLALPDTKINIPTMELLDLICEITPKLEISNTDYKKFISCEIMLLKRFYKKNKVLEIMKTITQQTTVSRRDEIIKQYGRGFGLIYDDGKHDATIKIAKNLLKNGFSKEVVSTNTGLSINEIKNIKRKL